MPDSRTEDRQDCLSFSFMRKLIAASFFVLAAAACTSAGSKAYGVSKPDIRITQVSGVPVAARHVEGGITVQYALRVGNNAKTPITLRRVTLQTVTDGAYYVNSNSTPFDTAIPAGESREVKFWVPATAGVSIVGANGPVTLRLQCEFASEGGQFQEIVIRNVNTGTSIVGEE